MKKKVVLLITLSDVNLDLAADKDSFCLCIRHQEDLMPKNVPARTGKFGLTKGALVRLWRNAIKDDDKLVDEAIQDVYDRTMSFDRERAEVVMSLIIRRHRDAQRAFKALLDDMRRSGCRPAPAMASTAL
jgi:hypothetical protein